jgi:hypothetical protein
MVAINKNLTDFVRPSPHSTFSPSSGDRWLACPFSIGYTKNIPEETSSYAEEGTFAHEVCEHVFRREFYGMPFPPDVNLRLAMLDDSGDEMLDAAEKYVDMITAWLSLPQLGKILWYGLEKGLPIFPELGCFGTADFIIIGSNGCAVIDFKYGKGVEVKTRSTQLKLYALAMFRHLKDLPADYEFNAVVFQPRISEIPKIDVYYAEEFVEFENEVYTQIQQASRTDLAPVEGSHCFWCPAKRTKDPALKCPVIKAKALEVANQNFTQFFNDMNTPAEAKNKELEAKRDAALMKIISLAPLISKMAKDAEEELAYRIQQGEAIPGAMLRDVDGRRKWRHDDVESMALELIKAFPGKIVDPIRKVVKLKTISELEKIVGKNKLNTLTIKPITKKLIIVDEKVQEVLSAFSAFRD